jgi:putative addiction module killer protein
MLDEKFNSVTNAVPRRVIVYTTPDGQEPFNEWMNGLRDVMGRKRILARVSRMQQGNFGDCKPVGEGVSELRMFFGSGYRVYFGEHGQDLVVLLCGGDKSSQDDDITQAKVYWREYLIDAES